jgi:hypothetical protein
MVSPIFVLSFGSRVRACVHTLRRCRGIPVNGDAIIQLLHCVVEPNILDLADDAVRHLHGDLQRLPVLLGGCWCWGWGCHLVQTERGSRAPPPGRSGVEVA